MKLRIGLVLLWTLLTSIWLIVIAVLIFRLPNFPLNLGLIRTAGRNGLLVTLLPALCGLAGVCLLFIRRKLGAKLLVIYSAFWTGALLGSLPVIWNAHSSFCIQRFNFCITTPWMGRLALFTLMIPFLLTALWSLREAFRP
jgi:hypothetical protein